MVVIYAHKVCCKLEILFRQCKWENDKPTAFLLPCMVLERFVPLVR